MLVTPRYSGVGWELYVGDCLAVLPGIDAVDMCLTDPPYGVAYSTGYRQRVARSRTRLSNDHLLAPLLGDAVEQLAPLLGDAVEQLAPLLGDAGIFYCFAAPERLDTAVPIIKRYFDVPNILVWDKGNCTAGDLETTYGQQWEACIYARKSRVPLIGGRDRDILRFSRGDTSAYQHPTQKPVPLMEYLIRRHNAETVIDPFCGSGTVGVACLRTGRKFIGIEIDEHYAAIAAKRLQRAEADVRNSLPFPEPEPMPKQATMFAEAAT